MTILHQNDKSKKNYNTLFSEPRNSLLSVWNVLFEENPNEWISFKPALGLSVYPCYACRHMFSGLSSLQDHVNRRVIVLKLNCAGCSNEVITFYNRCSLLLHIRHHFNLNGGTLNMKDIDMFPLPVTLAGFLPHPNIPQVYESEEDLINDDLYINAQFYSPETIEKGKEIINLNPSDLIFRQNGELLALKQVCKKLPKCIFITVEEHNSLKSHLLAIEENPASTTNASNENDIHIKEEVTENYTQQMTMPIIAKVESLQDQTLQIPRCLDCGQFQDVSLAEHYLGNNKPTDKSLSCSDCKMVASTACSLKAHKRIHSRDPPHVCPDCGKDFQSWLSLKTHLDEICFHLSKLIRYRCPGKRCGKLFANSATFSTHFVIHLNRLFACLECNIVVLNEESIENHKLLHGKNCNFINLYDCSLCSDIEALTVENFEEHILYHTGDISRCTYVYLCRFCKSYFRSTTTFAAHLMKCHERKNKSDLRKSKGYSCKYITKDCERCQNKIIYNIKKPVTVCNKCVQQEQNAHVLKNITKVKKRYFCLLCNKHIPVEQKLSHLRFCKYGRPVVNISRIYGEDVMNITCSSSGSETSLLSIKSPTKRCKTDIEESIRKKKKRIYIPNHRNRKPIEVQLDLTADEPIPFNGTYSCKLCEFTNTTREPFHEHIKMHRDISTAYQCMECGECFVVKPSLHKHLLHFHNITDYESYFKENDCYDIEAVKELEEIMNLAPGESKDPVKENQCRVCLQEFEDSTTMKKHYRIHGMAFLLKNSK